MDRGRDTEDDEYILYFGYGANMSMESLKARGIRSRHQSVAMLPHYSLEFDVETSGIIPFEHFYANIRPGHEGKVYGVLHEMPRSEFAKLVQVESPKYVQKTVSVHRLDTETLPNDVDPQFDDGFTEAMVFIYEDEENSVYRRIPGERYINVIIDGAIKSKLPRHWIDWLRSVDFDPIPDDLFSPQDHLENYHSLQVFQHDENTQNQKNFLYFQGLVFELCPVRTSVLLRRVVGGPDKDPALLLARLVSYEPAPDTFSKANQKQRQFALATMKAWLDCGAIKVVGTSPESQVSSHL